MGIISQIMFIDVTFGSITAVISASTDNEKEIDTVTSLIPPSIRFQTGSTVLLAPKQLILHLCSSETFQLRGHNIAIFYLPTSSHPVEANIYTDTEATGIKCSITCPENHCVYYATKNFIDCSMEPVVWRYNEASYGTSGIAMK